MTRMANTRECRLSDVRAARLGVGLISTRRRWSRLAIDSHTSSRPGAAPLVRSLSTELKSAWSWTIC